MNQNIAHFVCILTMSFLVSSAAFAEHVSHNGRFTEGKLLSEANTFTDVAASAGIHFEHTDGNSGKRFVLEILGGGAAFFDYDNDGRKDIFAANGHIQDNIAQFDSTTTYEQPNLLFRNRGDGTFEDVTSSVFPGLENNKVSRAVALGDYDNDGDIDILVTSWNGKVELLRNDGGNQKNWIKIKTVGVKSNRLGIGARIKVFASLTDGFALRFTSFTDAFGLRVASGVTQFEEVQTSGGFASTHNFRIHFGINDAEKVDLIEIQWPSGLVQTEENIKANQIIIATEGDKMVAKSLSGRMPVSSNE